MDRDSIPGHRTDSHRVQRRRHDGTRYLRASPGLDPDGVLAPGGARVSGHHEITADDLNKATAGHSFTGVDQERAYLAEAVTKSVDHVAAEAPIKSTTADGVQTRKRPTTTELNNVSFEHGAFTGTPEDTRSVLAGTAAANGRAPQVAQAPEIGVFTYTFTVGSDCIPHEFTGTVRRDGTVDGHALRQEKNGSMAEATLLPPQVAKLAQFAREDVARAQALHPDLDVVTVQSGLTKARTGRVSNVEGVWWAKLEQNAAGVASVQQAKKLMEEYSDRLATYIEGHPNEAREKLKDPNYMSAAQQYRAEHQGQDTPLDRQFSKLGVPVGATNASTQAAPTRSRAAAPSY